MKDATRESTLRFQADFSAAELSDRRRRLMAKMGSGIAVIAAATEVAGFDPFRQSNDFYYLTGVETPLAYLVMRSEGARSVLYLPARDEAREKANGAQLSDQDGAFVRDRNGIEEVRPLSRLRDDLAGATEIWLMTTAEEGPRQCQDTLRHHLKCIADDPLDGRRPRHEQLKEHLAKLCPNARFSDLSPLAHRQRLIKSAAEIEVMRKAATLSSLGCVQAMKATRAGVTEFQLGAIADYFFQINGAQGAGYTPIIATAGNIWMMHYWRNNAAMRDGELVLFDYSPDFNGYTSDIGRMWPVCGKFTAVQRELCGFALAHHKVLLSLIRPGRTKGEILEEAAAVLRPVVDGTRWSKPIYREGAMKLLASPRPLSHGVGMSVHEATRWDDRPMEPGLVFAVDPELVVPEESLYIRVEDTVVVTEKGIENLTASCPVELNEIEAIVGSGGLLREFPPIMVNPGR